MFANISWSSKLSFFIVTLSSERLLSGSADRTIKIWYINTGYCLQTLEGHTQAVSCIRVLSEEKIISGSYDKTIKIKCLKKIAAPKQSMLTQKFKCYLMSKQLAAQKTKQSKFLI